MQQNQETMGRSIASRFKHQFMYALIFIGGRGLAYLFLYVIVGCYCLFPRVRQKSQAYIQRRFAPASNWQFFKHTYLLNLTFGRTLIDRAALGILGNTAVSTTGQEQQLCTQLLQEGKGLILLSAHVGCWQMAVNLMQFLPGKKHVVMYRNPNDHDKTVSQHMGRKAPFHIINPAGPMGGVVEMVSVLQKGEVLCAMADRVFGTEKNTVSVQFFGGTVQVPYSFYRLAAATGAPIVILFFPWIKRGEFASRTVRVLRVAASGQAGQHYAPYAQLFMDELQQFCIKYPYQFFNYFNLWSSSHATDHQ